MQIAMRSGLPPSQILRMWSVHELQDAECLAVVEGWGQDWLRAGAIQAEIHNAMRQSLWAQSKKGTPSPKLLSAEDFVPKRISKSQHEDRGRSSIQQLRSVMNSMCGYKS